MRHQDRISRYLARKRQEKEKPDLKPEFTLDDAFDLWAYECQFIDQEKARRARSRESRLYPFQMGNIRLFGGRNGKLTL